MATRLMSGKSGTGPDTLSSIYARLSMQLEQDKPGTFWKLSEHFARAAQGRGNAKYAVRKTPRFAAQQGRGWMAVLQQANRMSRAMAAGPMAGSRPQLAHSVSGLVVAASRAAVEPTRRHGRTQRFQQRQARNDRGYDR